MLARVGDLLVPGGFKLALRWLQIALYWLQLAPRRPKGFLKASISNEMADKSTVAKINIDENPNTPTQFGVRGIPTMLVFKNGEAAATKVGAVSKTAIVEWIEDSIA